MSTADSQPHFRPTWVEISRHAFAKNLEVVRSCVGPQIGIVAMIKADAYGHGAQQLAQWCAESAVTALGVATVEEGLELRGHGITLPILVMGGLMGQGAAAAREAVAQQLTCVIHAVDTIALLAEAAKAAGVRARCHLKIDTGMSRMGARPETVSRLLAALAQHPDLALEGVMTHFAHVTDRAFTHQQLVQFQNAATQIRAAWQGPLVWHLGNSAAVLDQRSPEWKWCTPFVLTPGDQFWVRPGIMLYGIAPFPEYAAAPLHAVMQVKTRIALLKQIPTGTTVSYGGTWQAKRATRLAVLPIGYADGYPWALANAGTVLIQGLRVPVIGRVTMDMIMCDVTDVPTVAVGDEAVLLGQQRGKTIRAEEIALAAHTIPYEIVCRVSKRMPRMYCD